MRHFWIFLLIPVISFGQIDLMKQLKGMRARSLGPAGMSGRVTCIVGEPGSDDVIYVGTASGGLWKSENQGLTWGSIFDDNPVLSIGAMAVGPQNPDLLWVGTGEGNPRNSQTSGAGIYKSLDGGRSWQFMGLKNTRTIHRIYIDPRDENTVYVAAMGSAWGPNKERGVFKTTDGGRTWKKILYNNDLTGCAHLVMDQRNPNKLIAAMWEYERKPWTFNSGGEGSGLYITVDGGKNWKQLGKEDGLPKGKLGRIGLAISPSNPKVVYALVEADKLAMYKSFDGGFKWKKISDKNVGNRPFYYADIYVDPQDENWVYSLWSRVTYSKDGGKTFDYLFPYSKVHPDFHALWMNPKNPDFMIVGNDGGMSISTDHGNTWRSVPNLPVGQFYHINYDMEFPYNVYGGMQDNGSWCGPSSAWKRGGITNDDWQELLFGDGFDVVPYQANSRFGYAMYQGGNVYRYDRQTGQNWRIKPVAPDTIPLRFNWNAAITADPHNKNGLYFGSQHVHYTTDNGQSWKTLSPDLTTNDPEKQKQAESGGLTIDATLAENFTTILSIEPGTLNKDMIWVGTDDGNIQLTRDGGKTWTNFSPGIKNFPKGAWIPQIHASKHKEGEAFVVVNDYRRNNWKPYLYHTTDYGKTWVNIVAGKLKDTYCLSVVQDIKEPDLLFVGTENGLYFSMDHGKTFRLWKNGLPQVSVMDMRIHPRENDLVMGTFGRSIYILDDLTPLRELTKRGGDMFKDTLLLLGERPGYTISYKNFNGTHFAGDEAFRGQGESPNVMINAYIRSDLDTVFDEKGKIHVRILDQKGDTIRYFHTSADTGLHRIRWNMRMDGVRYPSWTKPKEDDVLPSGREVMPGTYTALIKYKKTEKRIEVRVGTDPRKPRTAYNSKEYLDMVDRYDNLVKAARKAFDHLEKTKKLMGLVNQQVALMEDDSLKKKVGKKGKAVMDSVKKIQELFMTPKDFEGYDHFTVRLNNYLGDAAEYLSDPDFMKASGNAGLALKHAEEEVNYIVELVNDFREQTWIPYVEYVNGKEMEWLKPFDPVKIK